MDKIAVGLFKTAPLLIAGVVLLLVAAAGSIPVGDKTLLPVDVAGRVVLGVVGVGLIVIHVIRGKPFDSRYLRIDPRPFHPTSAPFAISQSELTTVDALLDKIYDSIAPKPRAHSYGDEWVLVGPDGYRYYDIGTKWANCQGSPLDTRSPGEVGIRGGMELEIHRDKGNLWICLRALLGPVAGDRLRFSFAQLSTVDALLNKIQSETHGQVPAETYGLAWTLSDSGSGHRFNDFAPRDQRSVEQAGLRVGMLLEAHPTAGLSRSAVVDSSRSGDSTAIVTASTAGSTVTTPQTIQLEFSGENAWADLKQSRDVVLEAFVRFRLRNETDEQARIVDPVLKWVDSDLPGPGGELVELQLRRVENQEQSTARIAAKPFDDSPFYSLYFHGVWIANGRVPPTNSELQLHARVRVPSGSPERVVEFRGIQWDWPKMYQPTWTAWQRYDCP